jgi:hypothetical protein
MGSKWQKHFVRKWISDQAEAHSQMLILASRFLWFHFVQLIEKKKALPQTNIDQQYIMNVFHHVSKSSKPGQRDNKIDDDLLQETAEILNLNAEKFPVRVSQISKIPCQINLLQILKII